MKLFIILKKLIDSLIPENAMLELITTGSKHTVIIRLRKNLKIWEKILYKRKIKKYYNDNTKILWQ